MILASVNWLHFAEIAGAAAGAVVIFLVVAWKTVSKKLDIHLGGLKDEIREAAEPRHINGFLEALLAGVPYPAWVKVVTHKEDGSAEFRMQYLNKHYTATFGKSLEEYKGKRDHEVWPHAVAEEFYEHDSKVLVSRRPYRVFESVPMPNGERHRFEYEKIHIEKNGVHGIIGFLRPPSVGDDLHAPTLPPQAP